MTPRRPDRGVPRETCSSGAQTATSALLPALPMEGTLSPAPCPTLNRSPPARLSETKPRQRPRNRRQGDGEPRGTREEGCRYGRDLVGLKSRGGPRRSRPGYWYFVSQSAPGGGRRTPEIRSGLNAGLPVAGRRKPEIGSRTSHRAPQGAVPEQSGCPVPLASDSTPAADRLNPLPPCPTDPTQWIHTPEHL